MTDKPSLATRVGINWAWYLAYESDADFITILCETRFHRADYLQRAEWDDLLAPLARGVCYDMHESGEWNARIVQGISINGLYRPLRVPEPRFTRHYFDWRIFSA